MIYRFSYVHFVLGVLVLPLMVAAQEKGDTLSSTYRFIDVAALENKAIGSGFEVDSPLKGTFMITLPQGKFMSFYPPKKVSPNEFKVFNQIETDSFDVISYPIELVESVHFVPNKSYYLSSLGKYGLFTYMTTLAVASWAEKELSGLIWYNMWAGLYSLPIIALSGLLASTISDSLTFDGRYFFEGHNTNKWGLGISFGELPRKYWSYEDYVYVRVDSIWVEYNGYGYWQYDWVEKKLRRTSRV